MCSPNHTIFPTQPTQKLNMDLHLVTLLVGAHIDPHTDIEYNVKILGLVFVSCGQHCQPPTVECPRKHHLGCKTSTAHFPVPFGPIFQIFFFENFFDLFFLLRVTF